MSSFLARRIEVLSDTIFGVAMTTPVYSLLLSSWNVHPADWPSVLSSMLRPAFAFGCTFLFSGIFWISHHRRLTLTEAKTRRFLFVTFAFLFLIVLLPAPTVFYGQYGEIPWVAALYSGHLAMIACVNACLWVVAIWSARSRPRPWPLVVGPGILAIVFLLAAGVSIYDPRLGPLVWLATVLAPIADARLTKLTL